MQQRKRDRKFGPAYLYISSWVKLESSMRLWGTFDMTLIWWSGVGTTPIPWTEILSADLTDRWRVIGSDRRELTDIWRQKKKGRVVNTLMPHTHLYDLPEFSKKSFSEGVMATWECTFFTWGDSPLCRANIFLLDVRSWVVVLVAAATAAEAGAADCWGGANELMLPNDIPTLPIVDWRFTDELWRDLVLLHLQSLK